MRGIVNCYLNVRSEHPSVNAPNLYYLTPGDEVNIVSTVTGDAVGDTRNTHWYQLSDGAFVWSGGVLTEVALEDMRYTTQTGGIHARKSAFIPLIDLPENDPRIGWGPRMLGIPACWKNTYGENVKIAVLDSGVSLDHPELEEAIAERWNFLDNNDNVTDDIGHGTHICGILAAKGLSVLGICPGATIMVGKVLDRNRVLKNEVLLEAIKWARSNGADIVSMSLGRFTQNEAIQRVIKECYEQHNILFVGAVGDYGTSPVIRELYPAAYACCISVGAVTKNRKRFVRSSRSGSLDIMAPGEEINSTFLNKGYKSFSDTSFAVPFISGLLALSIAMYKSRNKPISAEEITQLLLDTADRNYADYTKEEYGFGIVNPQQFLQQL